MVFGPPIKVSFPPSPNRMSLPLLLLPQVLPRFIDVGGPHENKFVLLEDIIACKLSELFGGYESAHHATFRLTRDMDVDMLEQESDDMLRSIESRLRARQHSEAVRLEVHKEMSRDLLETLIGEELGGLLEV